MNNHELDYLVGMTEDAALRTLYDADISYRVVHRDSIVSTVTSDMIPERVNLSIDNGKVTKAEYG